MSLLTAKQMLVELTEAGMTDEEIAKEAEVSQPTVTRIRNGVHAEPKHNTWAAIHGVYTKRFSPPAGLTQQAQQ